LSSLFEQLSTDDYTDTLSSLGKMKKSLEEEHIEAVDLKSQAHGDEAARGSRQDVDLTIAQGLKYYRKAVVW
jgi:hypothetical protein